MGQGKHFFIWGWGFFSMGSKQKREVHGEGPLLPGCPDHWHQANQAVQWASSPLLQLGWPTVGQEPAGRAGQRCCGQHKVFRFQPRGRANFTPRSQKVRAWWPGWMRHSPPEAKGNLSPQTLGIRDKFNVSARSGHLPKGGGGWGLDSWILEEESWCACTQL